MLTYPSDPLPQIVCPMDEDAIPPNRFCSAPPHSDPPPPLLPLSSITPSCANDGTSGHRRSGRIQGIRAQTPKKQSNTDSVAAQKPSRQNPSPSKRQKECATMVQVSQSKQPRVKSTHGHEKQNEDGFDFSFTAEGQKRQKDRKSPQKRVKVSAAENVDEQFSDTTTQNLETTKPDMDTCGGLAVGHTLENASVPRGWVIGPLFQSFKSKMASFTEIVMSPVKLFKANSPPLSMDHPDKLTECELLADGTDVEHSEPSDLFHPEAQGDAKAVQQRLREAEGARDAGTVGVKYSKKLSFDVELSTRSSEQDDECTKTASEQNIPDAVPLQHSPTASASHESKVKIPGAIEEKTGQLAVRLKPLPRKCTGTGKKVTSKTLTSEIKKEGSDPEVIDDRVSRMKSVKLNKASSSDTEKTLSLSSSVCYSQPDTDGARPDVDDDDGWKMESCHLVRQCLRSDLNDSANGRTLKPALKIQKLNPEIYSGAGLGRAKRERKPDRQSQEPVKRRRPTADASSKETKRQLLNVTSDRGALRGVRPLRKEVVTNTVVDVEQTLMTARKRPATATRANKKGKAGQEPLTTISETVLETPTESSSDTMPVCSLDKSSSVSENKQKGSSSKVRPGDSCKRLKTRTCLGEPDVNIDNSMDLETTIAFTSTKQTQEEPLSEVLVRPDIKQLQNTRTCRNMNKKPLKRKSPTQASSTTESDSPVVSTSPALTMDLSEVTDFNTSQPVQEEESRKTGLNQPSKRPRKGSRGAIKSAASREHQETKQCTENPHLKTKESQSQGGKGTVSADPVYFEMTPFEGNQRPGPSSSGPPLDCSITVQLHNIDVKRLIDGEEKGAASVAGEVFHSDTEASDHGSMQASRLRSSARRVNIKPRRADNQRRKCRVLHSKTRKGEVVANSVTMDDADLGTAGTRSPENGSSRGLLRSYSCPEIPSLHPHDMPWTSSLHSPHHSRAHTPHQHQSFHAPFVHHAHKSLRRARRHTVCSLEVEREIAPLCLRKEVYPSRRSFPYDSTTQNLSPSLALSPSTSFSALASCFLSSPLAFLSKKVDNRGAAGPSTSSHVSSPTSSSSIHPSSPSTWRLSGFFQRTDSSNTTLDNNSSGIPLECEIERRQQSEEEDDGGDTSSSSQEFEDAALREEKALSDSEIKVVQKHEERGKVSSIRIRKTLPKPQNNLTPMGLPKPIRLKKKEFSLEEIYTNKNFSKPPESRLETIFEVPLNRRNGSESWFGQRRLKRFLEFLEVGEVRKPKKPLVGVGKASNSSSRTRRGGFPKDEPSLSVQDVDSLLCAKLDQLNLWLVHDQDS